MPDVCVIPGDRIPEKIITEAPLLCVEALSPRDSVMSMRARCMDYLRMGVPEVWIFDPASEIAYQMQGEQFVEVRGGTLSLRNGKVSLAIQGVFEQARTRVGRTSERS